MSEVSLIGMSLIKAEARLVGFFYIKKKNKRKKEKKNRPYFT